MLAEWVGPGRWSNRVAARAHTRTHSLSLAHTHTPVTPVQNTAGSHTCVATCGGGTRCANQGARFGVLADRTPTSLATESDEQHYHQRQVSPFILPDLEVGVSVTGVQTASSVPLGTVPAGALCLGSGRPPGRRLRDLWSNQSRGEQWVLPPDAGSAGSQRVRLLSLPMSARDFGGDLGTHRTEGQPVCDQTSPQQKEG